jgi:N-acylglucosamine-6-phosphate 2-epimerase
MLEKIKGKLIVSVQALEGEPLYDSYIMSKMALAAKEGGAFGIRSNSKEDIIAIKKEVDLPIIGLVKKHMIIAKFLLRQLEKKY